MDNLAEFGITWIDGVIVIIFVISVIMSLMRGFVREVVSILAWIAALILAVTQSAWLASLLPEAIDSASFSFGGEQYGTNIRTVIAFIIIFLAVLIVGSLINRLLAQITKSEMLRGIDKMLGVFFGCARASLVIVFLIIVSTSFTQLPTTQAWQQASMIGPFEALSGWLTDQLPKQVMDMSEAVPSMEFK